MSPAVLAVAVMLSGCIADTPPTASESLVLPTGFPLDVPLLAGSTIERTEPNDADNGPWLVVVGFSSMTAEDARDAIVAELEAAGYHQTSDRSTADELMAELDNGIYVVDVTIESVGAPVTTASYLVGLAPAVD